MRWLQHVWDGLFSDSLWEGSIGSLLGGLISFLVAWYVVRRQSGNDRKLVEQQIRSSEEQLQRQIEAERKAREQDRFETAAAELIGHFQAMADRVRRYAHGPDRADAEARRKDQNVFHDCSRELQKRLRAVSNEDLRETLLRVPDAFRMFSENFGRQIEAARLGQAVPDARIWANAVGEYIVEVVAEINKASAGLAVNGSLCPPTIPYRV